jgi:rubrerythrin
VSTHPDQDADRTQAIVRFVRLARQLEMDGYYNAAKLLWAAAYAEEIRASNALGDLHADRETLDRDFAAAVADLRAAGVGADVLAALDYGRAAAHDGRGIPFDRIPQAHVCRSCGHALIGPAPARCPECGAFELTFREFPPVYFLEPLPPAQALDALASVPDALHRQIDALHDDQMEQSPAPGEWSIRKVMLHLQGTQHLLDYRARRMLAEDNPPLTAVSVPQGDASLSARDLLADFERSRGGLVEVLRGIPTQDWWRTGQHEEFSTVTVLQQVSYFAKHDHAHLTQIDSTRRSVVARPRGK